MVVFVFFSFGWTTLRAASHDSLTRESKKGGSISCFVRFSYDNVLIGAQINPNIFTVVSINFHVSRETIRPQTKDRCERIQLRWPREPSVRLERRRACLTEVRSTCFVPWAFGERPGSVDVAWWAQLGSWLSVALVRDVRRLLTGWRFDSEPFSTACIHLYIMAEALDICE